MIAGARGISDLTTVLACAAVEPSLHGILLLDLPRSALVEVADRAADLLALRNSGRRPRVLLLGTHLLDDDLWTSLSGRRLTPEPGPLVEQPDEPAPLVVIPDLARANLAVSRAAVELLGSAVAHVEHHGVSRTWIPGTQWLAACSSAETGMVSAHLIDRFLIRFPCAASMRTLDPVARIAEAVSDQAHVRAPLDLPPGWAQAIAQPRTPAVSSAAVARAVELHGGTSSLRRPLALLRLGQALARLGHGAVVDVEHIDAAAALTGLRERPVELPAPVPVEALPVSQPDDVERPDRLDDTPGSPPSSGETVVVVASEQVVLDATESAVPDTNPYPEDTAEPNRELAPLRVAWERKRGRPAATGLVIGTGPATSMTDIAWVPTVVEALKYRAVRSVDTVTVRPSDLRAYRRSPESEYLLALLLDHTCRRNWDWTAALGQFLRWAYTRRAAVCVVEVGAAGAVSPLRAEQIRARSVLDPRVAEALSRKPGGATPLAHGLVVAKAMLRHVLQHGHAAVTVARMVVVTDGLGNVPLKSSYDNEIIGRVSDEGLLDALDAARAFGDLDGVARFCLLPPRRAYPQAVVKLADALGARLFDAEGG